MSQSPESTEGGTEQDRYLTAFSELAQRIRDGASFSGRERHCAFLNTGSGSFADISAVSGFGLPQDGRGMALTDWDHDGDLDVWMLNRTAPRAQFLQNRIPVQSAHGIALRLEGDPALGCPRDAIGSQIELVLSDRSQRRVKTLHAGEGLMSQSSKWLHFGLGPETTVEQVWVRWAGGESEEFSGAERGKRWHLKQGTSRARLSAGRTAVELAAEPLPLPPPTDVARIRLSQPLKTPELTYQDFSGKDQSVTTLSNRSAVLVNLWATWCAPCAAELQAFGAASKQLEQEGIQVLALNVDHLAPESEITPERAAAFLKQHGFTMQGGMAAPELVTLLNQSILKSVYRHRNMPVPVSFLIDRGGWLSAIYKGPVEFDQIVSDRRELGKSPEHALAAAVPFPGEWVKPHFASNPLTISEAYLEGDYREDARAILEEFVNEHGSPPGDNANPAENKLNLQLGGVFFQLGQISLLEQEPGSARACFEKSLAYNPRQIPTLNKLAWLLATSPDPQVRDGNQAVKHAEFMMRAPGVPGNPTLLGTLAASYAAAGRFREAADLSRQIIGVLEANGKAEEAQAHRARLEKFMRNQSLSL